MIAKKIDSFENRLRIAMENNGLTLSDLSRKSKISKARISRYLHGQYQPKQDALVILGETLNVNEAWLIGYDIDPKRVVFKEYVLTTDEIKLIESFRKLNSAGKSAISQMVDDYTSISRYID